MDKYRGISVEEFLTTDEIEAILNFAINTNSWQQLDPGSFWDNRTIDANTIYAKYDKEVGRLMFDIRDRISTKIKEFYKLTDVYADVVTLVRWFPGQEQPIHADDMSGTPDEEKFNHREFGSIVYLNNNYSGGKTYYSNYDIDVIPKPGMLAIHPGDQDHMHGVSKIEGATRYTIASFWTTGKKFYTQRSL